MIPQEIQTLSCLLQGRTGQIGKFPTTRPKRIVFMTKDGTRLRLIGFNACLDSIIGLGQKDVAGFTEGPGPNTISRNDWDKLAECANAVLFTSKGQHFEVEILKRFFTAPVHGGELRICFEKTGITDEFIPCRG